MSSQRETLWSIQYLRGFAALGVIIFHSLSGTGYDFEFGAIGIHLFFVISGFLMWTTTCRSDADVGRFIQSRLKRIVPIYWIATLMTVSLSSLFPGYFYQATSDPIHVITSLLFIPHSGVEGEIYPVLYQGWTLQYEMFFYAIFACSLMFGLGLRLWILTAIIATLTLCGMIFPHSSNPMIATYTDPICLEFLSGAWAAKLCSSRNVPSWIATILLFGGMAGLWLAFRFDAYLNLANSLATAGAASSIIAGAVLLERQGRIPHVSWLKYCGEASYSMYLFQVIGFLCASWLVESWPVFPKAAVLCLFAVAAGLIMFAFVERPLQQRLKFGKPVASII